MSPGHFRSGSFLSHRRDSEKGGNWNIDPWKALGSKGLGYSQPGQHQGAWKPERPLQAGLCSLAGPHTEHLQMGLDLSCLFQPGHSEAGAI